MDIIENFSQMFFSLIKIQTGCRTSSALCTFKCRKTWIDSSFVLESRHYLNRESDNNVLILGISCACFAYIDVAPFCTTDIFVLLHGCPWDNALTVK